MRKIYVVGGDSTYANWMQGEVVDTMEEADLVVFTGGSDIHTSLYHKPKNPKTYSDLNRDIYETNMFNKAQSLSLKCIGSCRGSQLLCVLNDGELVQHQENPSYLHMMHTFDGNLIEVNSTHHQAAFPFSLPSEEYMILGYTNNLSRMHEDGLQQEMNPPVECEIVYYPKTNSLGIQGHMEMLDEDHEAVLYCQNLLNLLMNNQLSEYYVNNVIKKEKEITA